jgi:hypothetical protein
MVAAKLPCTNDKRAPVQALNATDPRDLAGQFAIQIGEQMTDRVEI